MQLGMIGLGRMGANMVRRLIGGGHECVVFDRSPEAVAELVEGEGGRRVLARRLRRQAREAPRDLADGAGRGRRHVDRRSPAAPREGRHPDRRRQLLLRRRHPPREGAGREGHPLRRRRHERRRLGPRARLLHDDRRRGRGRRSASTRSSSGSPRAGATSRGRRGAKGDGGTAEEGYLHCGPNGAGHFVKMVHNGIEYGLMAAYAEGLDILRARERRQGDARGRRRDDAAPQPGALPVRPEPARHRRGLAARQRRRVVAPRPDRGRADRGPGTREVRGPRLGLGRGALDDQGRDRRGRSRARSSRRRSTSGSARAARRTSRTSCSRRCASSSAGTTRSPRSEENDDERTPVGRPRVLRGHGRSRLQEDLPVAPGDAEARPPRRAGHRRRQGRLEPRPAEGPGEGQPREARRARPRRLREALRAAPLRRRRLQRPGHVRGDPEGTRHRGAAGALPRDPARPLRQGRGAARDVGLLEGRPRHRREAVRNGPRLGAGAEPDPLLGVSRVVRSSGSTTTSASSRSTTCSSSGSRTRSWSRSGTATTSRACRSRWRRISASRGGARSTTRPARSATSSRTTSSRCSATWRWSRRSGPTASRSATRR